MSPKNGCKLECNFKRAIGGLDALDVFRPALLDDLEIAQDRLGQELASPPA